jgi:hypothetical protein
MEVEKKPQMSLAEYVISRLAGPKFENNLQKYNHEYYANYELLYNLASNPNVSKDDYKKYPNIFGKFLYKNANPNIMTFEYFKQIEKKRKYYNRSYQDDLLKIFSISDIEENIFFGWRMDANFLLHKISVEVLYCKYLKMIDDAKKQKSKPHRSSRQNSKHQNIDYQLHYNYVAHERFNWEDILRNNKSITCSFVNKHMDLFPHFEVIYHSQALNLQQYIKCSIEDNEVIIQYNKYLDQYPNLLKALLKYMDHPGLIIELILENPITTSTTFKGYVVMDFVNCPSRYELLLKNSNISVSYVLNLFQDSNFKNIAEMQDILSKYATLADLINYPTYTWMWYVLNISYNNVILHTHNRANPQPISDLTYGQLNNKIIEFSDIYNYTSVKINWALIESFYLSNFQLVSKNPHIKWNYKMLSRNTPEFKYNLLKLYEANNNIELDWSYISESIMISIEYIIQHSEYPWNWMSVSGRDDIQFDIIQKNQNLPWNWNMISAHKNIKMNHINDNLHMPWVWEYVSRNRNCDLYFFVSKCVIKSELNCEFEKFDWDSITNLPLITLEDITLFPYDKLNYNKLLSDGKLSVDFVVSHPKINWDLNVLCSCPFQYGGELYSNIVKNTILGSNLIISDLKSIMMDYVEPKKRS